MYEHKKSGKRTSPDAFDKNRVGYYIQNGRQFADMRKSDTLAININLYMTEAIIYHFRARLNMLFIMTDLQKTKWLLKYGQNSGKNS